jgi:serine/threonine protein kinase
LVSNDKEQQVPLGVPKVYGIVDPVHPGSGNLDAMAIDPRELPVPIGQIIAGRYVVTGALGRGGMGVVLAGRHIELGERVAIKFLNKEHGSHADRFFREARAAARIRSEHVVRIFDVGRLESGEPYIVMEYLEGEDLADRLDRMGTLGPEEVANVLLDVCQALAEAHASGIVHRDLKPANIFLARGPDGSDLVKLLDFGVAKMPEAGALTQTSTVLGSPIYMSPEQLMASRDVDPRSDIWSLGVVVYEMLTGALPFNGDSLVHLALLVREKPTPSARAIRADVPEALDEVIAKCLAKERADRYANVAEFAEAIAAFVSPGLAHTTSRIRRVLEIAKARRDSSPELENTIEAPASDRAGYGSTEGAKSGGSGNNERERERESQRSVDAMATSTASTRGPERRADAPPSRSNKSKVGIAAAVGLLAILGVWQVFARARPDRTPDERSVLSAPSVATTTPPSTTTAPSASTAEPSTLVAPSASASAEPPAALATTKAPPRKDLPSKAPPRTSASAIPSANVAAKPTVNCNPPFTIDDNGVRRAKPECL